MWKLQTWGESSKESTASTETHVCKALLWFCPSYAAPHKTPKQECFNTVDFHSGVVKESTVTAFSIIRFGRRMWNVVPKPKTLTAQTDLSASREMLSHPDLAERILSAPAVSNLRQRSRNMRTPS